LQADATKNMNTLTLTTPATPQGAQRLVLTNPDGETASFDAAFLAPTGFGGIGFSLCRISLVLTIQCYR
jgi:hypothetical protein